MPWTKRGDRREKLEEATTAVPLLKDTWVKAKLILSHIAGLSSLLSTMNTELAQLRYSQERMNEQITVYRTEENARWAEIKEWLGE